ncbi:MAG: HAD family hydrolase [Chloroflexi bacterium]|nr:HAD family hydrolase [Chloroflexota bacterium]
MALRAVFLDLDDTLCDYRGSVDAAATAIFDQAVRRYPHLSRERLRRHFDHILEDYLAATLGQNAPFLSRFERIRQTLLLEQVEDDAFAQELADHYHRLRLDTLTLFPDARATLEALKGRWPLVLVTNGSSDLQRQAIARLGIGGYFAHILVSQEVGADKPNPAIFQRALDAAGCRPHEALHVGDAVRSDVAGARAARVPVAWLNRRSQSLHPDDPQPDFTLASLTDLLALVERR